MSYWLFTGKDVDEAHPNAVLVVCPHHDGQYNFLYADSSVQQATFAKLKQAFLDSPGRTELHQPGD